MNTLNFFVRYVKSIEQGRCCMKVLGKACANIHFN